MSETPSPAPAAQQGPWFHLNVSRVIRETADASSLVIDIPAELAETFRYRAGQFLTFRVQVGDQRLIRCYSLASSPDTEGEHKVTIKRVAGGRVSNWINEAVVAGQSLEVMKPAGLFCLEERTTPLLLFSGGSGITPCISIVKTALATTERRVRLLYANRDARSIIFKAELDELAARHPGRLEVVHRLDDEHGFADMAAIREFVGLVRDADHYICGPAPFMDVVEGTLHALGIDRHQIFIERFESSDDPIVDAHEPAPVDVSAGGDLPERVTLHLDGKTHELAVESGKTILEMALAAGLDAPYACTEGYCGCCVATLLQGTVHMKTNDCLDAKDLERNQVLTCQSLPTSRVVEVRYPD